MSVAAKAQQTGAELTGWATRNKVGLGLAGLAAAGGLALYVRRRDGAAASRVGGTIVGDPQQFAGAGGTYDSTANDVYTALQGEIEGLRGYILEQLMQLPEAAPRPNPPVSAFPTPIQSLADRLNGLNFSGGTVTTTGEVRGFH